jgi:hypothetical protein
VGKEKEKKKKPTSEDSPWGWVSSHPKMRNGMFWMVYWGVLCHRSCAKVDFATIEFNMPFCLHPFVLFAAKLLHS